MSLKEILEDALPTKWSSYIAVLTVLSVIPVSRLPLYWPLSRLVTTNIEIQLFQALLSVSTLLTGTLICLILIIFAFHRQKKEYNSKIEKQRNELENSYQTIKAEEINTLKKEYEERIKILTNDNSNLSKQLTPKKPLDPALFVGFASSPKSKY